MPFFNVKKLVLLICITTIGASASAKVLHIFNPWDDREPLLVNTSYSEHNPDTIAFTKDLDNCGWYYFEADNKDNADQILILDGEGETYGASGFGDNSPIDFSSDFSTDYRDTNVYVYWDTENDGEMRVVTELLGKPGRPKPSGSGGCYVINLFSPWTENIPMVTFKDGTTSGMVQDTIHCGWYSIRADSLPDLDDIYFSNKFLDTYGKDGQGDEPIDFSSEFKNDTYSTYASYDGNNLSINSKRPSELVSMCLIGILRGELFDWQAGDFDGAFQNIKECPNANANGVTVGLLESKLGNDGLPEPADNSCKQGTIKEWFQEDISSGKSNKTCTDLIMRPNINGVYEANHAGIYNDWEGVNGFFPLDTFEHDNNYRNLKSEDNKSDHNYHYCMKVHTQFTYAPNQVFNFIGDDDVWVFIDGEIALDLGGVHGPADGKIILDDVIADDKKKGKHDFHLFYCERRLTQSNLLIQTDMDFIMPETYHNELIKETKTTFSYEIFEGKYSVGGCEPLDKKVERESKFYLSLDNKLDDDDEPLDAGETHYGGISIDDDEYHFSLDTSALEDLSKGKHFILHQSKSHDTEVGVVEFGITTSEYFITWANPKDTDELYNKDNKMNPVILGPNETQDYTILIYEVIDAGDGLDTTLCKECEGEFEFDNIDPFGIDNEELSKGTFTFTLAGNETVTKETFSITFTPDKNSDNPKVKIEKTLTSSEITVLEFPDFNPKNGEYYDMNSDGTMDRIVLYFKNPAPDSTLENLNIEFNWPNVDDKILVPKNAEIKRVTGDSLIAFWDIPSRYTITPFTTSITEKENNEATVTVRYYGMDEDIELTIDMEDKMPPILVSAWLYKGIDDEIDTLKIELSEEVNTSKLSKDGNEIYEIRRQNENSFDARNSDENSFEEADLQRMKQIMSYPISGDQEIKRGDFVRINDCDDCIMDLEGNTPGDSTLPIIIEAIVPDETHTNNFIYINPTEVNNDPKKMYAFHEKLNQGEKLSNNKAGIQKAGNMKELIWHLLDPEEREDTNPEHFYYTYKLTTYSSIGEFVNQVDSLVSCADEELFDGNCLEMAPDNLISFAIYTPPYSTTGRILGTGVYIIKIEGHFRYNITQTETREEFFKFGVLRTKN